MNREFIRKLKEENYKYVPITLNTVAFILGMCVFIPLGKVSNYFKSECMLYSSLSVSIDENNVIIVDKLNMVWGDTAYCYFTTYTSVVVAIHSFIWCWFHIQTIRMSEESQALPAMILSCVLHAFLFIILFISSCIITAGKSTFCANIRDSLKFSYECSEVEDMQWSIFQGKKKFYTYLTLAEVCCWLSMLLSLGQSVISGYKMVLIIRSKLDREAGIDEDDYDQIKENIHFPYKRFIMSDSGSMTIHPEVSRDKKLENSDFIDKSCDRSFKAEIC